MLNEKLLNVLMSMLPSNCELRQYMSIILCGLSLWGYTWFILEDLVLPGGIYFTMASIVILGYMFGHTLDRYTKIPPLVGMVFVGALNRNISNFDIFQDQAADRLDYHLRYICSVIILTRGALRWNWEYMRNNARRVFSMAIIPWLVECASITFLTKRLLGFPWYWGLHLGSILSSVSPTVFIPLLLNLVEKGYDSKQITSFLINSGGLDTVFSVDMFGVINSAIFHSTSLSLTVIKAILAIFVGIALGVSWAYIIDYIPSHEDRYAALIKSLLLFGPSLLFMYAAPFFGWGGTNGVFVTVSAGAAANRWSRRGWAIGSNPVLDVFNVLWRIFEPILFTLGGCFLELKFLTWIDFQLILCCLFISLGLRIMASFTIAVIKSDYNIRECVFISICWIPKAIIETAMVRLAMDSALNYDGSTTEDYRIARLHANIIIIAVLITSLSSSMFIYLLGPTMLKNKVKLTQHFSKF